MHLDLLPSRHARWHSHHNLLPGMVDEELLTRLDARRHLYGKEWHAPALRFQAARDRFMQLRDENRGQLTYRARNIRKESRSLVQ